MTLLAPALPNPAKSAEAQLLVRDKWEATEAKTIHDLEGFTPATPVKTGATQRHR